MTKSDYAAAAGFSDGYGHAYNMPPPRRAAATRNHASYIAAELAGIEMATVALVAEDTGRTLSPDRN